MKTKITPKNHNQLNIADNPELMESALQKKPADQFPAKKELLHKEVAELYQLLPKDFAEVQDELEEKGRAERESRVFVDSLESQVGYDSLFRILSRHFGRQMAYWRSDEGGALSEEEALKRTYGRGFDELDAVQTLNKLLTESKEKIDFAQLMRLHRDSPAVAENLWEMIKREAKNEFESGHLAGESMEAVESMQDAWNRARFLGVRESFCREWQPRGGIELAMIDMMVQTWLQFQHWVQESVKRSVTDPREEDHQYRKWKKHYKAVETGQVREGHWDVQTVSEQSAIEHAGQMADRWQRMHLRAVRSLRDWRRHNPPVTINNPQQVNIAGEGGQQINLTDR